MSTVDLLYPKERMVCFFCQKPLLNRHGRYVDLNLCTSAGVAVLTCSTHAVDGDKLVAGLITVWKKPGDPYRIFDPVNDLNAIHAAVQSLRFPLTQGLWKLNQGCLENVVERDNKISRTSVSFQWEVQNATARQRTEAFLRTTGK